MGPRFWFDVTMFCAVLRGGSNARFVLAVHGGLEHVVDGRLFNNAVYMRNVPWIYTYIYIYM